MLIGVLIAVVVIRGVIAAVLLTRRSHDDVHSVEHYHRQLHTLEEMRGHPVGAGNGAGAGARTNGSGGRARAAPIDKAATSDKAGSEVFPASASRISGSSTVRLTGTDRPVAPPVP